MEDNVALGIRISVTIVLVASLVATVLTLMVIGQSILGGGQNKLQTGLSQVQQQDLVQYANVTKKGSVVKSTISLYQGEPVAILVKTSALAQSSTGLGDGLAQDVIPASGTGMYFNYGCLLKGAAKTSQKDDNNHYHVTISCNPNVKTLEGQSYLEGQLLVKNGIKQTNFDTKGTVSIGNAEAILDNGLFYSQLIKDITGEIIGIIFTQQA